MDRSESPRQSRSPRHPSRSASRRKSASTPGHAHKQHADSNRFVVPATQRRHARGSNTDVKLLLVTNGNDASPRSWIYKQHS